MKKLHRVKVTLQLIISILSLPTAGIAQSKVSPESLSAPGPENTMLSERAGIWEVTETVWPSPGASPVTTRGLVAERKMVGSMLQEFLYDSLRTEVKRTDLLTYNRIEGRWDYVSFDTRVPLGLMPAWSAVKGKDNSIELSFYPFALLGAGNEVTGQMLRMDQTITYAGQDEDRKDQYFMLADGTATRWLAHRYSYTRKVLKTEAVPAAGKSTKIDEIKKRGTLRVAVLAEYPWLKATLNGDVYPPFEGPAWVLAEEFAKRLGVRLETVPVDFEGKVSALKTGKADLTIAPLLATPQRMNDVDMINYSMSAQALFGRSDNPKLKNVTGIDGLNRPDITIAFIEGSPQGKWLSERLPQAGKFPVPGNLADVAISPVLSGKADVANIDKFFFAGLKDKNPGLISIPKDYLASQESLIPVGMAIAKGQPAFLAWLRSVAEDVKVQIQASETRIIQVEN